MVNERGKATSDGSTETEVITPTWGDTKLDVSWPLWESKRSLFSSPEIPKLVEGSLPSKLFYNLSEAARIAKCTEADLLHYAGIGKLRLHTSVPQGIALHAGDSWTNYWGQRDMYVELLQLSPQACRRIEMHGSTWEDRFFNGWSIDFSGHAVSRIPQHQDPGAGGMGAAWGCFSSGGLTSIQIGPAAVFVLSFDLDALLKGQYSWPYLANAGSDDKAVAPSSEQNGAAQVNLQPKALTSRRFAHDHISDELRWMIQGAAKFWGERIDPSDKTTFPKNPTVSAWLQEVHGMSLEHAKTAASIMRLHFAPKGGRPKSRKSDKKTQSE